MSSGSDSGDDDDNVKALLGAVDAASMHRLAGSFHLDGRDSMIAEMHCTDSSGGLSVPDLVPRVLAVSRLMKYNVDRIERIREIRVRLHVEVSLFSNEQ